MKASILLPLALVAGFLGSLATRFLPRDEPVAAADPTLADRLDRLTQLVTGYEERQAQLEESLNEARLQPVSAPVPGAGRVALEDVDAAVARWMSENADQVPAMAGSPDDGGAELGVAHASIDQLISQIMSEDSIWENDAMWEELRNAGRIEEVVAEIEQMAERDPNNPDLQVTLGGAYLQQLFGVGNSPVAGALAAKADDAFERALDLDENHWEARFSKAVSLSNWPAFLGKAGEAIEQFEILVGQQELSEPGPGHDQTYLFLGNMYQQTGESAKALEVWRKGYALFPDSQALGDQLQVNERPR